MRYVPAVLAHMYVRGVPERGFVERVRETVCNTRCMLYAVSVGRSRTLSRDRCSTRAYASTDNPQVGAVWAS